MIEECQLDQAKGRISTLMGMAAVVGQPVWFVAQEVDLRRPNRYEVGFRKFSRTTHLIPWVVEGFVKRNTGGGFKAFTPRYEISPDVEIYCAHGSRAITLDYYNTHGMPRESHCNNAVFTSQEDAVRYQTWLMMAFDEPSHWLQTQRDMHLGIMTIPEGLVKMRNT